MTSVIETTKQYLSGFRVPDFKKLWYGQEDQVDDPGKPLLLQFEAYLVKLQELSLWTDPKSSVAALAVVHVIYWYLTVTTNTPVYLLAMLALLSYVYLTWTQRIWPEIRVPDADAGTEPDWTPVSPDVLSAPELVKLWDDVKIKLLNGLVWAKDLRRNEPGKFCALFSTFFVIIAYVGTYITTLGLTYYVTVGYLTIPGVLKILVKHPAVQCMLETMKDDAKTDKDQTDNDKPAAPVVEPVEPTLVESVYATFQTGLNAVSNLNLKSEFANLKSSEDDMNSLLPEVDETNQSILESAMNSSIRDPMQAHNLEQEEVADSSLEYASLLPVTAGNVMPDDIDELDAPSSTLPLKSSEEDEFLPSETKTSNQSKSLIKFEDDEDEEEDFAASLIAAAAEDTEESKVAEIPTAPTASAVIVPARRKSNAAESDVDDFEMISEEELAQVSP